MANIPLHVLFVTSSFPLQPGSSSGIFIKRLIDHLPKIVHATILTPDNAVSNAAPIDLHDRHTVRKYRYAPKQLQVLCHQPGGIPVALKQHPWLYTLVPLLLFSLFLHCLLLRKHIDVIHANWSINGLVAGLAGKLSGKPVITTIRGEDVNRAQHSHIDRFILRHCMRLSRYTIAVSDSVRKTLEKFCPANKDKLIVIPNGVALATTKTTEQASAQFHLVTVGSLIERKSIETIIHAVERCDNCQLSIIGDGPERERLEKIVNSTNIGNRITFLGSVEPDRVQDELIKANAFIIASRSEGRPNALLEAMAVGLPVIASDIDSHSEIIKPMENGLLFETGNMDDLVKQVHTLQSDTAITKRLGDSARQFIVEKGLTWENAANRYVTLYNELSN